MSPDRYSSRAGAWLSDDLYPGRPWYNLDALGVPVSPHLRNSHHAGTDALNRPRRPDDDIKPVIVGRLSHH
jgi:hypothetical protein